MLPQLARLGLLAASVAAAQPRLESVFPLGASPGSTVLAEARGNALRGATGIWFPEPGISATILGAETEKGASKKPADLLRVELRLDATLAAPWREFRVITPAGLSNPLRIWTHAEPAIPESSAPHDLPTEPQKLSQLPAAIHGRIAALGEVDYYSFHAAAGEHLWFRTISSDALDPGLGIYKLTGSWFDPTRAKRLAFSDERVAYPGVTTEALLEHTFAEAGEYLVRVNGFWGNGGPGQNYLLLITRTAPSPASAPAEPEDHGWAERSWTRPLHANRMAELWSRAVEPATPPAPIPVIDADAEPTKTPVEPPNIPLPALITGTIERPGDIDRVTFSVKEGDRLSFEIETPGETLPLMNPLLRIVDDNGVEALTNILSVLNSNSNVSKQIHPKTQYSFPRAGRFTLEIRDITATYGGPAMRYRVIVRPQVPHMGTVRADADCLNLTAGKAQKLSIVTDQEEGFDGYVVLSMEGLPAGVHAVPATEVEPDTPPATSTGKRERFVSKSQKATLVLLPAKDAPPSPAPVLASVWAQPVVKGELGKKILVKEIPVMVVKASE
ncbi:MAG: hypothetical protein R2729_16615 [Bryobacteraceae bacterium]